MAEKVGGALDECGECLSSSRDIGMLERVEASKAAVHLEMAKGTARHDIQSGAVPACGNVTTQTRRHALRVSK